MSRKWNGVPLRELLGEPSSVSRGVRLTIVALAVVELTLLTFVVWRALR